MIKNIWHDGPGIHVEINASGPSFPMTASDSGRVRYNGSLKAMETYDGYAWVPVGTNAMVGLTADYIGAIEWAKAKREQEQKIARRAELDPVVRDALESVEKAQEQLQMVLTLTDIDNK